MSTGGALISALAHVAPHLRSEEPFWEVLSPSDSYVRPDEDTHTAEHLQMLNERLNNVQI